MKIQMYICNPRPSSSSSVIGMGWQWKKAISSFYRITGWFGLKRDLQRSSNQPLCHGQGHFLPGQVVQSPAQPDLLCRNGVFCYSSICPPGKKKSGEMEKVFYSNLFTFFFFKCMCVCEMVVCVFDNFRCWPCVSTFLFCSTPCLVGFSTGYVWPGFLPCTADWSQWWCFLSYIFFFCLYTG